jgi:DNA-binding LacI/PurR family transcriptional regulator
VAVEPTRDDTARWQAILDGRDQLYDGVVIITGLGAPAPVDGLSDRPVVVVQGGGPRDDADTVDDDVAQGRALVARHLAVMGCRRPAVLERSPVGAMPSPSTARPALAALGDAGFDIDRVTTTWVAPPWDRRAGAEATAQLIRSSRGVDALVCANDEIALGALGTLVAAGVKVPQEVAVVGYDNLDDGQFSTPSLTTVDPRASRLARTALDLVSARLSGTGPEGPHHVTTPVDLVRRESTLGAGGQ